MECGDAHFAEVFLAFFALVEVGECLDLVADFAVGGKVFGSEAVFDAEPAGRLALGGEVLGYVTGVHQSRCEERDLPADSFICHVLFSPRISSPGVRRWAVRGSIRNTRCGGWIVSRKTD